MGRTVPSTVVTGCVGCVGGSCLCGLGPCCKKKKKKKKKKDSLEFASPCCPDRVTMNAEALSSLLRRESAIFNARYELLLRLGLLQEAPFSTAPTHAPTTNALVLERPRLVTLQISVDYFAKVSVIITPCGAQPEERRPGHKRVFSRDFLLQFQSHCTARPADLTADLYVVEESQSSTQAEQNRRQQFFAANGGFVQPHYRRYLSHFQNWLPRVVPSLFSTTKQRGKRFFDVGSAPGGLCAFLVSLGASGRACSLGLGDGGFDQQFKSNKCRFSSFDMSQPDAWRALLDQQRSELFDFIMLGITLQWHVTQQDDQCARGRQLREILRNEILFALNALKPGGSLMIVLPASDHPNSFFYLHHLLKCSARLHLFPTPHASRSPVYVLAHEIDTCSEAAGDFLAILKGADPLWYVQSEEEAYAVFRCLQADLEALWRAQSSALAPHRTETVP
jgi:SAM-dependent methyltransferase